MRSKSGLTYLQDALSTPKSNPVIILKCIMITVSLNIPDRNGIPMQLSMPINPSKTLVFDWESLTSVTSVILTTDLKSNMEQIIKNHSHGITAQWLLMINLHMDWLEFTELVNNFFLRIIFYSDIRLMIKHLFSWEQKLMISVKVLLLGITGELISILWKLMLSPVTNQTLNMDLKYFIINIGNFVNSR